MSDENRPGDVPPDLPPEYAEAYRRGYERALSEGDSFDESDTTTRAIAFEDLRQPSAGSRSTGGGPAAPRDPFEPAAEERTQVGGPLFADEPAPALVQDAEPTQTLDRSSLLGQMLSVESDAPVRPVKPEPASTDLAPREDDDYERRDKPTWLVPLLLGIAAVVLIGAAFGIGKWVSSSFAGADMSSSSTAGGGTSSKSGGSGALTGKKYSGPVEAVAIQRATASCQAPNGVDAAGNTVSYAPRNMIDRDPTTAWRCDGSGVGQRVTLTLPPGTKVAEVGLIPGYAKTDPTSGANRYAQNNRITKVRWTFDGGISVVQILDGSPHNRSMQTMRVPEVTTDTVVITILSSTPGPRRTIAVTNAVVRRPA